MMNIEVFVFKERLPNNGKVIMIAQGPWYFLACREEEIIQCLLICLYIDHSEAFFIVLLQLPSITLAKHWIPYSLRCLFFLLNDLKSLNTMLAFSDVNCCISHRKR